MNCAACGNAVNADARFCSACGNATASSFVPPVQAPGPMPPLVRPQFGRAIAGVCAGFAQHFGWDVVAVRLVLVAAVLLGFGTPILAYAVAWIAMPEGPYFVPEAAATAEAATNGSQTASTS